MARRWLLVPVMAMAVGACASDRASDAPEPSASASKPDIELAPDSETIAGQVPPGATLGTLLVRHDLISADVEGMLAAIEGMFDVRRIRAGQPYLLERAFDRQARRFEYEIDALSFLRVTPYGDEPHHFAAEVVPYDVTRTRASVAAALEGDTTSLFAAMGNAGELPDLSIALADIFAGEVDFNSELQPGARFQLSVDKAVREGKVVAYGPILAATLHNDGRDLTAIRFQPAGGHPGYYDAKGQSLKRFFLRSPLKFDPSISSGFSRSRLHPVLNVRRAHLGVDYRAPTGAPVVAVSQGTVTLAAWTGGGGRTVKVRHASGYETAYLHLSSFGPGIRAGIRVAQGQLIGRVGSTGLATGPHLHYELRKNGSHVNPTSEHRKLPPGEPVPAGQMGEFSNVRDEALRLLVNHRGSEPQGRTE